MSIIKAKFWVVSIVLHSEGRTINMQPVFSAGSEENKEWSNFRPSANLSMTVTTDAFADAAPGDQYYLMFEKAE